MSIYLRIYFVLFVFERVSSQCTDGTRPYQVNVTAAPQYISSPNYPNNYDNFLDCAWLLTAPSENDRIIINVEEVNSEGISEPCSYDYLAIFDGADNTSPEVARLCNVNHDDVNALVSTTNTLYITFTSDFDFVYKGFQMLVFANDTANQPACSVSTTLTATSEHQVLMSPNLPNPYEPNLLCLIKIYPETLFFSINIDLYFMDMANSTNCLNGSLEISAVSGSVTDLLLTDCRSAITYTPTDFPLQVVGSYVLLNFSTADDDGDNYGYMLEYYEIFKGINMTSSGNGSIINLAFPENEPSGHLNESVAVVVLTYTGSLTLQILPSYTPTTSDPVNLATDIQIFSLSDEPPYLYLDLVTNFDYEVIKAFVLLVTIIDTDVPLATYSVTFNITISDVNDVKPTFGNLPNNQTLKRNEKTGLHLYTINATDEDATAPHQVIDFEIFSGNTDSMFHLDATSGELTLSRDAKYVPLAVTEYVLVIAAYSGTADSRLGEFSTYTVHVDPDSPPTCTLNTVRTETIDSNMAAPGDNITFLDAWSCSDDRVNITFAPGSVVGNLTSALFDVNTDTGDISLLRSFDITEVLDRQFVLEIIVTDSVSQTVNFFVYMNVTALTCLPNPRRLYVRMDQDIDGVILSSFNCTKNYGMSYTLSQYPEGTFDVIKSTDDTGLLVLRKPVIKLIFYSLTITITDNVDIAILEFQVIIQSRRCYILSDANSIRNSVCYLNYFMYSVFVWLLHHLWD